MLPIQTRRIENRKAGTAARISAALGVVLAALTSARPADASLLSPEAEAALATYIALFVVFVVPVVLVVLFWMVHILPEKIAHKRNHPQFEAIRTLCLLSLVFGGLLWPLAWLWAYTKPVLHKMAYGTDVHPDAVSGHGPAEVWDTGSLHDRLARLEARGVAASELEPIRASLEALESKFADDGVR